MARISGVDLPHNKRTDIALTYLYGIGRSNVKKLLDSTKIDGTKRIKDLNEEEINRLQKGIDKGYKVEGDLRIEVSGNIKRLREIGSYRGMRHARNLPVHGQRTRSNARTRKGRRKTIANKKIAPSKG